jgi:hypothetical protein
MNLEGLEPSTTQLRAGRSSLELQVLSLLREDQRLFLIREEARAFEDESPKPITAN